MRQRVMIAMALSCKPALLIADEPTTALDVTIQAQILELMKELQQAEGTAIILITHDLGVVANICRRVNVMYAGRFVEEATVDDLFARPRHPYTLGLLQSIPRLDTAEETLTPIRGQPPDLIHLAQRLRLQPALPERRRTLPEGSAAIVHGCKRSALCLLQRDETVEADYVGPRRDWIAILAASLQLAVDEHVSVTPRPIRLTLHRSPTRRQQAQPAIWRLRSSDVCWPIETQSRLAASVPIVLRFRRNRDRTCWSQADSGC